MRREVELNHKEQKTRIDLRGGGLNEESKSAFLGGAGIVACFYVLVLITARI